MNTKTIDLANIALMLLSCIAAFVLPFEVFLFSYAVLGPLHYLTEISWLHKRDYFANGKQDYWWLILIGVLLVLFTSCGFANNAAAANAPSFLTAPLALLCDFMSPLTAKFPHAAMFFIYVSFISAIAFVAFSKSWHKILFIAIASLVGGWYINVTAQANGGYMSDTAIFFLIFAVFLPTLIHVFVFTGLFILHGALKNKSTTGYISIAVFITCAVSFFVFHPHITFYHVSNAAQKALEDSGFIQLNKSLLQMFHLGEFTRETVYESNAGLGIMRFIAFAYTYHYLNWFSKTQVIKWHQVPKQQLAVVIVLWLLSIALYAYSYYAGLVALYFLSMLHVLLEFPLNYRSITGIGTEVRNMFGGTPAPAVVVQGKGKKK